MDRRGRLLAVDHSAMDAIDAAGDAEPGRAVGDRHHGVHLAEIGNVAADGGLGLLVEGARHLIEDQKARLPYQGP